MASYQKTHAPDLSEEFPLGYSLFTMKGREEVVPFTTPDNNMTFRWEHTTVNVSDDWITIITPEVSVPGFLQMKGQIVKLANKPGSIVRVIRIKDVGLVVKLMDADQNERIGVIGLMLYKLDPPHS